MILTNRDDKPAYSNQRPLRTA